MSFLYNNIIGIIIACVIILLYIKIKKRINYFADRGLQFVKPTWIDQIKSLSINKSFDSPSQLYNVYRNGEKPYVGFFSTLLTPNILLLDNSIIQNVLIKDFSHFHDHGIEVDAETNPLFGHLFNMKGDHWRTLRHKLTPTFTSGKLKGMVPVMEKCANDLIKEMNQDKSLREEVNMKLLFSRYTLSVIALCAFGLNPDSFQDPDCEFKKLINQILNPNYITMIKFFFLFSLPKFAKFFKIKLSSKSMEDFFFNLTRDSFEMRKKSGVKRNDFIQLLLELKEKGSVEVDAKDLEEDEKENIEKIQSENLSTKLELTDELLTAQVFVFLVGGFDNSSFIAAITAYVLSKHPEMQKRVRQEIRDIKNKHGVIDYVALRDMKLLGACVDEALRLFPPVPVLLRLCNKNYSVADGENFEKDLKVIIPVKCIHTDSRYWSNPDNFDPERFLNGEQIHPGTYLPFGDGPRICIAQRLALIIGKLVIAKVLEEYEILPSKKTKEPLKMNLFRGANVEGGLWGNFKRLEQ